MNKGVRRLTACLAMCLCLSGCGGIADTGTEGLLDGLAREDWPDGISMSVSLDISGAHREGNGVYVEARETMNVMRRGGLILMADAEMHIEKDGAQFGKDLEVWSDGETAYSYIGDPGAGGVWYEHSASGTEAAGIDPVSMGRVLSDMAEAGLNGLDGVDRSENAGSASLSFPVDPGPFLDAIGTGASEMSGENPEWSAGSAVLTFDASSGEWLSGSIRFEGESENYLFEYGLDMDYLGPCDAFDIPDEVVEAAEGNYVVGPADTDEAVGE